MTGWEIAGWVGGVLVAGVVVHGLLSIMENRGWIYYRRGGGRGATSATFGALRQDFEPSAVHIQEAQEKQDTEEDRDGAPPG